MMKCEHCGYENSTVLVEIREQTYDKLEFIEHKLFNLRHPDIDEFADFVISEFIDICKAIERLEYDDFKSYLFRSTRFYIDELRPEWSKRQNIENIDFIDRIDPIKLEQLLS